METTWIAPRTIIGSAVTGSDYYVRESVENKIWEEIKKGNNILIAAPRRVGKTSIMKSFAEKSDESYKFIFRDVQGITEESAFYKTIYELILSCLSASSRYKKQFVNYFKEMKISEITSSGVKFGRNKIDYLAEINQLIPQLDAEGETIVLLIDELPEVLHNLHKHKKDEDAHSILKNLRHWRVENGFEKIQFLLAGSIGIHYVIDILNGRPADINDLYTIHCPPLDAERNEFEKYMDWITKKTTIQYDQSTRAYLKEKIGYLTPFFINLLINEIDEACRSSNQYKVSTADIDSAIPRVLRKQRHHFSDWKKRLQDYMPKEDFAFVNELLIRTAHKGEVSIQGIYDTAVRHKKTDCYMEFIADLEQDGYLTKHGEKYVFISPFLKEFWKNDNPIYNE